MAELTSRERVEMALRFQKPDRVPFNFWMDRRLLADYERRYGEFFRVERYGADAIEAYINLRWPMGKTINKDGSDWLVEPLWRNGWEGDRNFDWPDPEDPSNFEMLARVLEQQPDKAVFVNVAGVLTVMHWIELEEQMYLDFFERPDEVRDFFERIGGTMARFVTLACERFPQLTAIYVQDDVCSTQGAMFSQDMLERFIYPANDQPIQAARAAGKPVIYHSDGMVFDILEHLIGLGVAAVNPLQQNVHDYGGFMERFGGRIGVYGGLDNLFTIPDGTPEDVRQHVLESFRILGTNGALILSSHDIPPHCLEANIDALVRTIHEECRY